MQNFEDELRRALARQSPPPEFNARVLNAIEQRHVKPYTRSAPRWLSWTWSWRFAPAFAGAMALSAGLIYWQHEREQRGLAAKQQLLVALHIAGSELQHARERILMIQGPEAKQ